MSLWRVAIRALLGLLMLAQTDPSFKVDLNLIRVEVQVTEKGRPVMGLRPEQFTVLDNGVAQPIVALMAEEQPLDLVLLVDLSGSMLRMLDELRKNVAGALKQLRPVDRIGVIGFATESKVELDLTEDHARAVEVAKELRPIQAGTEINRNLELAALYLQKQARVGAKRVILILMDNLGERLVADRDVVERIWNTDVVVHGLLFTPSTLVASLLLLCCAVMGMRVVMTIPIALRANWVFRITMMRDEGRYLEAVRGAFAGLGLGPVMLLLAGLFVVAWPWEAALIHVMVLGLWAWILCEFAMGGFAKIRFACSYLPGKANVHVRSGAFAMVLIGITDVFADVEKRAFESSETLVWMVAVLVGLGGFARWRRMRGRRALTYEELPDKEIHTIELYRDGKLAMD